MSVNLGCFSLSQNFWKFQDEVKWKGPFRFGPTGIFFDHLWRWTSLTGRSGPTETCRSIYKNSLFQSRFTVV